MVSFRELASYTGVSCPKEKQTLLLEASSIEASIFFDAQY